MRAHTIITEARVRGRGRTKRTILTLSLAVALFAPTASSAGAGRGPYLSEGEPSVTSGAGAVKFKGHTNQGGRDITVRVGDDGLVDRVKFHRRLRCQPPLSDFSGTTTHSAPLDESTPTGFADKTRNTDHGGQVRVKSEVTGEKISDTEWTGTAQVKSRFRTRHGYSRCKTGEIDWSATLVS